MAMSLHQHFARLMKVTQRRWTIYLDRQLADLGLTSSRWNALVEISRAERLLNQRELAERLGIEGATLVHLLDGLTSQGLIERRADEGDRRIKRIEMTARGESVIREIASVARDVRHDVLQGISEDELKAAVSVLEKIGGRLDQLDNRGRFYAVAANGVSDDAPVKARASRLAAPAK